MSISKKVWGQGGGEKVRKVCGVGNRWPQSQASQLKLADPGESRHLLVGGRDGVPRNGVVAETSPMYTGEGPLSSQTGVLTVWRSYGLSQASACTLHCLGQCL